MYEKDKRHILTTLGRLTGQSHRAQSDINKVLHHRQSAYLAAALRQQLVWISAADMAPHDSPMMPIYIDTALLEL